MLVQESAPSAAAPAAAHPPHELDRVAAFVHGLRIEDLPAEVVERARTTLMDGLGVMLAGTTERRVQALGAMLAARGSRGDSTFATDGSRADAADAALVNGTASCAFVLDEGHKYARGHVATYVLPTVLAVAEEQKVSGSEFIVALVAAYEIAARMGVACRVREAMHPSGTWGTIGAAAASARMMGFAQGEIRETMTVAAPLTLATSWQAAVDGATVRDLYSGVGAGNGVLAPRWVKAGFTGAPDDVAHVFGHVASERFDRAALVAGLGERFEIMRNYFKVHACCRNFQSAIDVAVELKATHRFTQDDIRAVKVETFAIPVRDNATAEPRNVLAARESLPVSLALALIHGRCDGDVYTDAKVYEPEVRRIASATSLVCDPELDRLMPEQRPSRVHVTLADGREVSGYQGVALGDPVRPVPPAELEAKFAGLARSVLTPAAADALREAIARVDRLPAIGELTRHLAFRRNA